MAVDVLRVKELGFEPLRELLGRYALILHLLAEGVPIPGSYWGDAEAGLIGNGLYARPDTPVHSVLHEAAHFVCMDSVRRACLYRDAGGDHTEEDAVCYLQVLWADALPGSSRERMWQDMDAWGYTFRLGSARRWFEVDAEEARAWLERFEIIDADGALTWRRRERIICAERAAAA